MNDIKNEIGMNMETLVTEINSRFRTIRTMHEINNQNIHLIDHNFKMVFQELNKMSDKLTDKMENDIVSRLIEIQKDFKELKQNSET